MVEHEVVEHEHAGPREHMGVEKIVMRAIAEVVHCEPRSARPRGCGIVNRERLLAGFAFAESFDFPVARFGELVQQERAVIRDAGRRRR